MTNLKLIYCKSCDSIATHDINTSKGGYLHSLCMGCGADKSSDKKPHEIKGQANKPCENCKRNTEQINYISQGGYIHWFCCSCGFDISSSSRLK